MWVKGKALALDSLPFEQECVDKREFPLCGLRCRHGWAGLQARGIPYPNPIDFVITAGEKTGAIRAEGRRENKVCVSLECAE